jgi:hypothetical protein
MIVAISTTLEKNEVLQSTQEISAKHKCSSRYRVNILILKRLLQFCDHRSLARWLLVGAAKAKRRNDEPFF